jgi:hypothetical protein
MKLYKQLAKACGAYHRCVETKNEEWQDKWSDQIKEMMDQFPSGSGFDNGTHIDLDASGDDKLVFNTSFHHMDENGMYDGWTEYTVTITPSLGLDYRIKVSGRDRNDIKEYIADSFALALDCQIEDSAVATGEIVQPES